MKMSRLFLSIALLVASTCAVAAESPPLEPLRDAMSDSEFKAAGLDKLSPAELSALDAWLRQRVGQQTARAVEQAKEAGRQEVQRSTRGFFDFGSEEPIVDTLAGEFNGFAKGRSYTLQNGQVWEQVDNATLPGVRKQSPGVRITPSKVGNHWYLRIDGYNTAAYVRRIK
ncbi:hypothetical protein J2X02_002360 [Pseudoxanthomonas japonensis]|uniref:hypothetical protein n=1 Tax=Pseudoxanthomonas TaxID=83618 RepID=UPI0007815D66|nr:MULTISPECIES: hypothetical protein [Pseudoxanthomonas]MBA3929631.1 hypothetical protein [Xanthomonas sp.]MBL8256199.1 hypothetical protein [Pseudoxanthomonas mexicana]MDR7069509.1 hypothetical protein [Pseudoxanthomonas japonensis]